MSTTNQNGCPYWKKNLLMLWISQLLVLTGFAAMMPFISLYMESEMHITDQATLAFYITLFNGFGTLAYAVSTPIWGWLSDKWGVKPMLLRGTFITAPFFVLMGYTSSPGVLIFLRFITAACAGTTAASYVMIARCTPDNRQGYAQGILSTAIWGGSVFGNVVGGLIIHYFSYLYAFWFCGILYVVAGIFVIFTRDNQTETAKLPPVEKPSTKGSFSLLPALSAIIWLIILLFFTQGLMRNVEIPYVALRIKEMLTDKSLAEYYTGVVSAVVCAGAILSGIIFGYLSDKVKGSHLILPIMLVAAASVAIQGCVTTLTAFTISRTLLYLVAGGIQPILQKQLSQVTPVQQRGTAFGLSSAAINCGGVIASIISGCIMARFGIPSTFYSACIILILATPLFISIFKKVEKQLQL